MSYAHSMKLYCTLICSNMSCYVTSYLALSGCIASISYSFPVYTVCTMLFCVMCYLLHHAVFHCIVLYRLAAFGTVLYCIVLYDIAWFSMIFFRIPRVLYWIVFYRTITFPSDVSNCIMWNEIEHVA